ncbi:potassium channel family protein [uncultured Sphingomonas sp.]|jgi:voltage-gated potassium channel|uniref:potassium channel family protein n=1 Tax=unclassified Sphingomonas TaxID=196159 RepID=UPI0025E97F29|nr:potassium channel family protein [uncultured Sphingomonas sp.]
MLRRLRPNKDLHLRRRSSLPDWASLALRVALAFALVSIALGGHWLDREGLRDNIDGHISFKDVLYFTMITVTTVGYGDIVPVTDSARMFDTFIVTPIRLFVWLIFLGTAYDFLLKRTWQRWRMSVIQRQLTGHVVIAGYGTSGTEALRELIRRGTDPATIVVVDRGTEALEHAEQCGAVVLDGDATRDKTLEAARIERASTLMVSAGRDDTTILIVLTARRLSKDVRISAVIRSDDNEALARQAGADVVINPASFAGLLLAGSTDGPHVADYLNDLAATHGRVALRERDATAEDVGRPLIGLSTGLGVRLFRRGACIGFDQPGAQRVELGDRIVEIVKGDALT